MLKIFIAICFIADFVSADLTPFLGNKYLLKRDNGDVEYELTHPKKYVLRRKDQSKNADDAVEFELDVQFESTRKGKNYDELFTLEDGNKLKREMKNKGSGNKIIMLFEFGENELKETFTQVDKDGNRISGFGPRSFSLIK